MLLVAADGTVRSLDGDSADLARVVIRFMAAAHTREDIVARVEALAGPLGDRVSVVNEMIDVLRSSAVIEPATDSPLRAPGLNVVLGVSGAIAATHAPALVRALHQRGHTVEVALTPTAQRFVASDALTAITQRQVHASMWPIAPHEPVPHVALAEWADLVIIYPASATTIARLARGDYSELVAAIASCTRAPVVVVPSMNAAMLDSPAVARNVETLQADGRFVIGGVPSVETAHAPALRHDGAVAAPSPMQVVASVEALRAAGVIRRSNARATTPSDWDAMYRAARVPWARDTCDADIAEALVRFARTPVSVLDVGTGLGQVARHAAAAGHRVVATDVSDVALALASKLPDGEQVVWLRDDVCATQLATSFDIVIDRATLHTLPAPRAAAWFAAMHRLVRVGGHLIVKAHADGVPAATEGWSTAKLERRLASFELVESRDSDLPGLASSDPVPAILAVFRRAA